MLIQHLHAIESNGSSRGGSCNSTGSVPFSGSAAVRTTNSQPGLAGISDCQDTMTNTQGLGVLDPGG